MTLAIAILGLALGLSSLLWNVLSHRRSGVLIKVSISVGLFSGPSYLELDLSPGREHSLVPNPNNEQRFVLSITVRNVGRLPASVSKVEIVEGQMRFWGPDQASPNLPAQIGVSEEMSFLVDGALAVRQIETAAGFDSNSLKGEIFGRVYLGNGATYETPHVATDLVVRTLQLGTDARD